MCRPIPSHYIGRRDFGLPFQGGAKTLGWSICHSVDRPGPWWTVSFMENPTFPRASLSNVRVIMEIMRILVEEFLSQTVTGRSLVLECLLLGVRGHLWLRLVLPDIKWHRYPGTPTLWSLDQYLGYPWAWLPGPQAHAMPGHVGGHKMHIFTTNIPIFHSRYRR
jgi:hypothetical protein